MRIQITMFGAALLLATVAGITSSHAQEPRRSLSNPQVYQDEVVEAPATPTRKQLRSQMLADQRTLSLMQQQASGEYAARPTVRFPNYHTYQPTLHRVYVTYPSGWYRSQGYVGY